MLIVADSGSSITDWICLLPNQEKQIFETKGLNPFFVSEKEIIKVINNVKLFQDIAPNVKEVHFFGAGCNSPDKREIISNALSAKFRNAFINVESDLLGSAYATCGTTPGLNCILGTGSNISFFDGNNLHDGLHGLGYILGDEGSETYFGKNLITDFLYKKMPDELAEKFHAQYKPSKEDVIKNIYQRPLPNHYLASFAPFLKENVQHPYIKEIITKGLEEFIKISICSYSNYKELYCHFVGDIAYHFQEFLIPLCNKYEIHIGKILEKPIYELYEFVKAKEGF
jgi:N-acetylglucosamine kinase-like BadF-type ATPase